MYTWKHGNVKVHLNLYTYRLGRNYLQYQLIDNGEIIFMGDDFSSSPLDEVESEESVMALLGFLTCQLGDTDDDYFKDYTPQQLDWIESQECEDLKMVVYDFEANE